MPLFSIDVEKVFQGEYWTNRYLVEMTDLNAANAYADAIVSAERVFHTTPVTFTRVRVADTAVNTDISVTRPINLTGQATAAANDLLPLFNAIRVDLPVAVGRPSRKYYRGCLAEANTDGQQLVAGTVTLVQNAVDSIIADGFLSDPDGQPIVSAVVFQAIGMRQLRRGSRRRTQPVL